MRVALLCGGLGGARLAPFLAARHRLTAICNVADDLEWMGLHVSPDVDSVLYALAGLFDHERGYGVRGDTGRFMDVLEAAGEDGWFRVGDRDLQTHVLRTAILRAGRPLSSATAVLGRALGVEATVLPASDDRVRTIVSAGGHRLDFQSFYVREGGELQLDGVQWEGMERALPAPGLLEALSEADLVVFAESSPIASILPILELPGVRAALAATPARRVALSPVVLAVPPCSDVDRHHWRAREHLLQARGLGHDPASVARLYRGSVDVFVIDRRDRAFVPAIGGLGITALTADLLDRSAEGRARLVGMLEALAQEAAAAEGAV